MNSPKDIAGSIVKYTIKPEIVAGDLQKRETLTNHRYDLLTVVMIGLDKKSFAEKQTKLHGLLGTVFSEQLKPDQKIEILYKDYGMKTVKDREEGVATMCNLSDEIEERGMEQKLIEQICRKIRKGKEISVIAEELEEEESVVRRIYEAALHVAPDYDKEQVYEILYK